MEVIFGRNPVLEALRAGRPLNRLLVLKGASQGSIKEIIALARQNGVLLQFAEKKQLDFLCGTDAHQGVLAQTAVREYADWEEILEKVKEKGEIPLFLLLDGIEDPQNLGAILRTADAAGVQCVIIPKHRAVPLTSGVAKASAGAVEYVPVARVTNIAQTIDRLKEKGFWVVGTDAQAGQIHYTADLKGPLALALGNESKGLGTLVKTKCDYLVRIPMCGQVNSLNVSAAASVILYEALRQRSEG